MTNATPSNRQEFVAEIRDTDAIALLDYTRDGYQTVIVATLTSDADQQIRAAASDAGYVVATIWETNPIHYVVFTTTPDAVPKIVVASTPPKDLVTEALEYFSDSARFL